MTYAPESLKAARRYLLDELDMHPGRDVDDDLDPDEVGIISTGYGDSYHRGKGYIGNGSYSAYFERDRRGLSGASSGLDIGEFDVTKNGRRLTLFRFNAWLVEQCEANTPDTRDIREVIYTLDGRTVKRWDRHKRRSSGDNSHLWHTHISYYRDSERHDKTALFRRYVEGDDDMPSKEEIAEAVWSYGILNKSSGNKMRALSHLMDIEDEQDQSQAMIRAILAAVTDGQSADQIVGEIQAQGEQTRAALAAKLQELAPELARAVAEQVDHDLDEATVEAALRTVLGSVDNPTP